MECSLSVSFSITSPPPRITAYFSMLAALSASTGTSGLAVSSGGVARVLILFIYLFLFLFFIFE
jgi:hypothetical protein